MTIDDTRSKLLAANAVRATKMQHCLEHLKQSEQINMPFTVNHTSWDDAGRNLVVTGLSQTSLSCWGPSSTDVTAEAIVQGEWREKQGDHPRSPTPPPLSQKVQQLILRETKKRTEQGAETCVEFRYPSAPGLDAGTAWAVRSEEDDDVLLFWQNGSVEAAYFQEEEASESPEATSHLLLYPFDLTRDHSCRAKDVSSFGCGDADASKWSLVLLSVCDAVRRASRLPITQTVLVGDDGVPRAHVAQTGRAGKVLNLNGTGKHGLVELVGGYTVPAFVLRASPNLDETLCTVPLHRIRAVVEESGDAAAVGAASSSSASSRLLQPVTLYDLAKRAGTFGSVAGIAESADLSNGEDETCTVRVQAVILPKSADGSAADYTTYCHHYQTRSDANPGSMYVLATPIGSFYSTSRAGNAAVKPYRHDAASDVLSSFCLSVGSSGKAIDDAVYTKADKAAQAASNVGVATEFGPVGCPPSASMTMLFQLPLKPKPPSVPTRSFSMAPDQNDPNMDGVVYRSLGAMEEGEVTVASLGFGAYDGDALKVADPTPVRDTRIRPTVTISLFYSLAATKGSASLPGECAVSTSDLKAICKDVEHLYHVMGNAKLLSDADSKLAHLVTADMHAVTIEDLKEAAVAKEAAKDPPIPKRRRSSFVPPPVVASHA